MQAIVSGYMRRKQFASRAYAEESIDKTGVDTYAEATLLERQGFGSGSVLPPAGVHRAGGAVRHLGRESHQEAGCDGFANIEHTLNAHAFSDFIGVRVQQCSLDHRHRL